jgi:hypothetical protein
MQQKTRGAVVIDWKVGEDLVLDLNELRRDGIDNKEIRLTLKAKHGQRARVAVQAGESIRIRRPEKTTV